MIRRIAVGIIFLAVLAGTATSSAGTKSWPSKYPGGVVTLPVKSWHPLVGPVIMAKVERVHVCEEGRAGWHVRGPNYFGGLGWKAATWSEFRARSFPLSAADATPEEQAWSMDHFIGAVFHGWWPDQDGCTGAY